MESRIFLDVSREVILYDQKSLDHNLREMRNVLTGGLIPRVHHIHQAPSSRILWLAAELSIPLDVIEVTAQTPKYVDKAQLKASTDTCVEKGGFITSFNHGPIRLLESGAIIVYLLEKYDNQELMPPIGSVERAKFFKYLFYAASTADHLVLDTYSEMFVVGETEQNRRHIQLCKQQWDQEVALELTNELKDKPYLCGNNITGADIMFGWTLFTAAHLGWVDDNPILQSYLNRLQKRPAFARTFIS